MKKMTKTKNGISFEHEEEIIDDLVVKNYTEVMGNEDEDSYTEEEE